jgi:hypothetical protein
MPRLRVAFNPGAEVFGELIGDALMRVGETATR